MKPVKEPFHRRHHGSVLIVSMIFLLVFSTLAVSMVAMAVTNAELDLNHHKIGTALSAAESGLVYDESPLSVTLTTTPTK